ncbi:hypothetical protein GGF46_002194 [Coemansia sp. RSA 552]|nr:hypothetical protein GGF46_002194 [Coemansia sp. RSA 552]
MGELDGAEFDLVVLGTGLEESLLASEVAATGQTVLHVDRNPFYGGLSASFTLSRLFEWALQYRDQRLVPRVELIMGTLSSPPSLVFEGLSDTGDVREVLEAAGRVEDVGRVGALLEGDRGYSLELVPRVALCRGAMVDLLVDAGVGEYVQFRGIEHNYLVREGGVERVPESKEDVFASKQLSLIEKRKLMRLMTTMADEQLCVEKLAGVGTMSFEEFVRERFKLDGGLLDAVVHAVARADGATTAAEGCGRVRAYVNSIGRYGRMAYLCGLYGGASEIAQAFTRLCAVSGGTYILDETIAAVEPVDQGIVVKLDHGAVRARRVVMDPSYAELEPAVEATVRVSRALCILDKPALGDDTTALATYVGEQGVVSLLYMTQATMAVPKGQSVLYAWMEGALEARRPLLAAALAATYGNSAGPLLTLFMEMHALKPKAQLSPNIICTSPLDASVDFDGVVDAARHILDTHFRAEEKDGGV